MFPWPLLGTAGGLGITVGVIDASIAWMGGSGTAQQLMVQHTTSPDAGCAQREETHHSRSSTCQLIWRHKLTTVHPSSWCKPKPPLIQAVHS